MLTLHIGLPKTASTYLQSKVFLPTAGLTYVHRRRSAGKEKKRICAALREYVCAAPRKVPKLRKRLILSLRALDATGLAGSNILVTNENVTISSTSFWLGVGPTPEQVSKRLASLRERLGEAFQPLKVILGIRRQDQWLASRYAESSKNFPEFGQVDFDRRIAAIASVPTLEGPLRWLDHEAVRRALVEAVGRENLFLLPLERLAADETTVLAELARFLDVEIRLPGDQTASRRRKPLGTGANTWRLKCDGEPLVLSPEQEAAVLARFADSNAALRAASGPGLPAADA